MFIWLIVKNFYGYSVCNLVEFEDSEQGHPRSGSLGELLPPVLSSSAPELQGDWTEVRRRLKEKKEKKRKVRCFCETQGHSFGKNCRIYGFLLSFFITVKENFYKTDNELRQITILEAGEGGGLVVEPRTREREVGVRYLP